jgi:hypothetical protein
LQPPSVLENELHATSAINELLEHPDASAEFNTNGADPALTPTLTGTKVTGYIDLSDDLQTIDFFQALANMDSGGEFFAVEAQRLSVDRHIKEGEEPIQSLTRVSDVPGTSNEMELSQGNQSVEIPEDSGTDNTGSSPVCFDIDFDMQTFELIGIFGTIDLLKLGMSGLGFDEAIAYLGFYTDGQWYFGFSASGVWSTYGVEINVFVGQAQSMAPRANIDPFVVHFLEGVTKFNGFYAGAGVSYNIFDFDCALSLAAGANVAGWYISGNFGLKVQGWIVGQALCLISVKGQLTILGGEVNDIFKITADFWIGGGLGWCEPDNWNFPEDVLNDDWCASCVGFIGMTGTYPPDDFDLQVEGPDFDCAL